MKSGADFSRTEAEEEEEKLECKLVLEDFGLIATEQREGDEGRSIKDA